MKLRWLPLLLLIGCGDVPRIDWPAAGRGATPMLLPMDDLAVPASPTLDARGAALAAQAAALKARAAADPP